MARELSPVRKGCKRCCFCLWRTNSLGVSGTFTKILKAGTTLSADATGAACSLNHSRPSVENVAGKSSQCTQVNHQVTSSHPSRHKEKREAFWHCYGNAVTMELLSLLVLCIPAFQGAHHSPAIPRDQLRASHYPQYSITEYIPSKAQYDENMMTVY